MEFKNFLEILLPSVLVEEIFLFYHPTIDKQKKQRRKIHKDFDKMRKTKDAKLLSAKRCYIRDLDLLNKLHHPTTKIMLNNLTFYNNNKKKVERFKNTMKDKLIGREIKNKISIRRIQYIN